MKGLKTMTSPAKTKKPELGKVIPVKLTDLLPDPHNERSNIQFGIEDLVQSILQHGIQEPIQAYPAEAEEGKFIIKSGHRRKIAAQKAGFSEAPVLIVAAPTGQLQADIQRLVINMQRLDLSDVDKARGLKALMQRTGLTQVEMAKELGLSQSYISNLTRMLRLPEEIITLVAKGELSANHTFPLMQIQEPEIDYNAEIKRDAKDVQIQMGKEAAQSGASVRQLENDVKRYLAGQHTTRQSVTDRKKSDTQVKEATTSKAKDNEDLTVSKQQADKNAIAEEASKRELRLPVAMKALQETLAWDKEKGPSNLHMKLATRQFADYVYNWKENPPARTDLPNRKELDNLIAHADTDIKIQNILAQLSVAKLDLNGEATRISDFNQGPFANTAFNVNTHIERALKKVGFWKEPAKAPEPEKKVEEVVELPPAAKAEAIVAREKQRDDIDEATDKLKANPKAKTWKQPIGPQLPKN
jgi:ParB family chromosome partitioning protein